MVGLPKVWGRGAGEVAADVTYSRHLSKDGRQHGTAQIQRQTKIQTSRLQQATKGHNIIDVKDEKGERREYEMKEKTNFGNFSSAAASASAQMSAQQRPTALCKKNTL